MRNQNIVSVTVFYLDNNFATYKIGQVRGSSRVKEIDIDSELNEVIIVYEDMSKVVIRGLPFAVYIEPFERSEADE